MLGLNIFYSSQDMIKQSSEKDLAEQKAMFSPLHYMCLYSLS